MLAGTAELLSALANLCCVVSSQGGTSCWLSVLASGRIPVHITSQERADGVYQKHAGHVLLGVRRHTHMITAICFSRVPLIRLCAAFRFLPEGRRE